MCVCVCERERERERESPTQSIKGFFCFNLLFDIFFLNSFLSVHFFSILVRLCVWGATGEGLGFGDVVDTFLVSVVVVMT